MTTLLLRLAFAGIRTRLLASALTVAIAGAAAATIVLALEVRSTGVDPWQRTFDAANGAHVLAYVPSAADAERVARLPDVSQAGEPLPIARATLRLPGGDDPVRIAGLGSGTPVNAPVPTEGAGVREGGIVLERSLARALRIPVGARVELAGDGGAVPLTVVGTAVSPSQPRYPRSNPGLAWVTRSTLDRIAPDESTWQWAQALRIADPSAAAAFADRVAATFPADARASGRVGFETWQAQRDAALLDAQVAQLVVTAFTLLLLVVAFVVVGLLVGARATDQRRDIGLLKAGGFTPRLVALVFAVESVALGLAAALVGFAAGAAIAPRLTAPSADTLIAAPTVAASPWHAVVAAAVVVPVLLAGALGAARRSTRSTVVEALRAGVDAPPRSRLARAVDRLPLPVTVGLGLNGVMARRRRAVLIGTAIALAGATAVFALSLAASLDARPAGEASDVPDELPVLVYTLDAALLIVVITTVIAIAGLSVRERMRELGVLRALGLTPRQVRSVLVSGHVVLAAVASLVALPLGAGMYFALYAAASGTTEGAVLAPWWWLASVPAATVLLVIAAVGLPTRLALRVGVADALRYE